ncbi:MAG: NAD-dependent epimerase/dehydratase family protein [Pseudomonadota bacterium]|nr:NAD-dependent epimerase/dehydratase family protein [Pseudomonadota bacterium]
MSKLKVFCFGFGQVAESFVNKLIDEKKDLELNITTRQATHEIEINNLKINCYQFNDQVFDDSIKSKLEEANYVLVSIPPVDGNDIVANYFDAHVKNIKNFKWVTYLSATSVYGDHKGDWVNEKSSTNPTSKNGIDRLNAERAWESLSSKINLPLQIFRLAGIYSYEFNILKRLKNEKVQIVDKKNHFFSRIHVEDIANILFSSLNNFKNKEIYNISDDKPASQTEVAAYGAKLLKIKIPNTVKLAEVNSEMLKNFYKDSKKVDNKKMKKFFNYNLKFPTYVEGLNHIFNNNT